MGHFSLYNDRIASVKRLQPGLKVTFTDNEKCRFAGIYRLQVEGEAIADYEIKLEIYAERATLPKFWLARRYYEFCIDRHTYQDGECCYEIEANWRWKFPDLRIDDVINVLIRNFLLSQIYYDKHRKFPFGEWQHGFSGILQCFAQMLRIPTVDVNRIIEKLIWISGRRISTRGISPFLASEMLKTISSMVADDPHEKRKSEEYRFIRRLQKVLNNLTRRRRGVELLCSTCMTQASFRM